METVKRMKKAWASVVLVTVLAAAGGLFTRSVFDERIEQAGREIRAKEQQRALLRVIGEKKQEYEKEWKHFEPWMSPGHGSREVRNQWTKKMIAFAEDENIVFKKLQPQGIGQLQDGEEIELYVQFQGRIQDLIRLMYYFIEKDPAVRVHDLSIEKEDPEGLFNYELTLGRVML